MTVRLSTRISIKWGDESPSEPTHTVVLSVGDYFMDLRVIKTDQSVDWAFAGIREVVSQEPRHCRWHHTIDSRQVFEPDEGSFQQLPDGDDLETGIMSCPERNGQLTFYEEVWRQIEPPFGDKCAWILKGKLERAITFLGRYGGLFLAMGQDPEGNFTVRKEELVDSRRWSVKFRSGGSNLPSLAQSGATTFPGESKWRVGEDVRIEGEKYTVCALVRNRASL